MVVHMLCMIRRPQQTSTNTHRMQQRTLLPPTYTAATERLSSNPEATPAARTLFSTAVVQENALALLYIHPSGYEQLRCVCISTLASGQNRYVRVPRRLNRRYTTTAALRPPHLHPFDEIHVAPYPGLHRLVIGEPQRRRRIQRVGNVHRLPGRRRRRRHQALGGDPQQQQQHSSSWVSLLSA